MMHIYVMNSHKPIRIYMGGLILGVNSLYRPFCFFKLFPMVGKGLKMKRLVMYARTRKLYYGDPLSNRHFAFTNQ